MELLAVQTEIVFIDWNIKIDWLNVK